VNHIGGSNKMVGDTPISDSTPHNVADLGMLCRRLERELNASTSEIERLTNKVAQLYEGAEEQHQRIKRLEQENDAMRADLLLWEEKEVKL
jgi:peptidoglycan hydrolase CwlO-like protein